jgi:hypothetical protein
MDAAHLVRMFGLGAIALAVGRFVLSGLEQAGDGLIGALAGPDEPVVRGIGLTARWTEPWWSGSIGPDASDGSADVAGGPAAGPLSNREPDGGRAGSDGFTARRAGRFIVPLAPVAPVRFRTLAI